MKKNFLMVLLTIFVGSAAMSANAVKTENKKEPAVAASALTGESKTTNIKLSEEEINCLVSRLHEIRGMDKDKLSTQDKRALRQEVKDIKHILKTQDYVLYISLTALLIILLLIILL